MPQREEYKDHQITVDTYRVRKRFRGSYQIDGGEIRNWGHPLRNEQVALRGAISRAKAEIDRIAADKAIMDEIRTAVGHFLSEFALFETIYVTEVLKAVSRDATVIEHLPELMDLHNRLKLLKYLGVAEKVPKLLMDDINAFRKSADELREWRNEIAHGAVVLSEPWATDPLGGVKRPRSKWVTPNELPLTTAFATDVMDVQKIRECADTAVQLQAAAQKLAEKLENCRRECSWKHIVVSLVKIPKRSSAT